MGDLARQSSFTTRSSSQTPLDWLEDVRTGTGGTDEDHPELLSGRQAGRSSGTANGRNDRSLSGRSSVGGRLLELSNLVVEL